MLHTGLLSEGWRFIHFITFYHDKEVKIKDRCKGERSENWKEARER